MSIDPKTLPLGTVVLVEESGCVGRYTEAGRVLGVGERILRTFSPDPTPDQEVPREEWANIKPGSRVRVEFQPADEANRHPLVCIGDFRDIDGLLGIRDERVYLLDEPADPEADLRAKVEEALASPMRYEGHADQVRDIIRIVREHEAES